MKIRRKLAQNDTPGMGVLDAQSIKCGNLMSDNGFDDNKRVKGVNRSVVVDRNGFIFGRKVDNASIHDTQLAYPLCLLSTML